MTNIFQDYEEIEAFYKKQIFELQRKIEEMQGKENQLRDELKNTKISLEKLKNGKSD